MATTKMSAEEKKWRAESDARTLVEYQKIMEDSKRRAAAMNAAKSMAAELEKSTNRMKLAAGGKLKK